MPDPMPPFLFPIWSMRCNASTPIAIYCPKNRYIHRPASLLLPVPRLLLCCIHLPVSMLPLSLLSCIYTATIVRRPYLPPTLSDFPIILYLYRASIAILLRL